MGGKTHPYFIIMNFTNLIGAITLAGTLVSLNIRVSSGYNTQSTQFSNQQIINNQTLTTTLTTLEFDTIDKRNIIKVKSRAKAYVEMPLNTNQVYTEIQTLIVLEPYTNINLNKFDLIFSWEDLPYWYRDNPTEELTYKFYQITALTQDQEDFINGKAYTSYDELKNTYVNDNVSSITPYAEGTTNSPYDRGDSITNIPLTYNYFLLVYEYYGESTVQDIDRYNYLDNTIYNIFDFRYTTFLNTDTYEVIDLPGLMFDILAMPFAWFSIAFNFTLFQGTPYAINVGSIILSIIVGLISIIIIKLILRFF